MDCRAALGRPLPVVPEMDRIPMVLSAGERRTPPDRLAAILSMSAVLASAIIFTIVGFIGLPAFFTRYLVTRVLVTMTLVKDENLVRQGNNALRY
jgi:hypothetical protein